MNPRDLPVSPSPALLRKIATQSSDEVLLRAALILASRQLERLRAPLLKFMTPDQEARVLARDRRAARASFN